MLVGSWVMMGFYQLPIESVQVFLTLGIIFKHSAKDGQSTPVEALKSAK